MTPVATKQNIHKQRKKISKMKEKRISQIYMKKEMSLLLLLLWMIAGRVEIYTKPKTELCDDIEKTQRRKERKKVERRVIKMKICMHDGDVYL